MDITSQKILILGASSGIGYAVAEAMAEKGVELFLVARRETPLMELKDKYEQVQGIWSCDLSREENVKALFTDLRQREIKLDGMVHCAGMAYSSPCRAYDEERFQQMCDINLKSVLATVKYFSSKRYTNDKSVMTIISSASTDRPEMGRGEYTATKGALNALIPILAKEVVGRKMRVNAVSPGFVRTELYDKEKDFFDVDAYIEECQPLGLIEPDAVADMVCFLHSDSARYITGQNIFVDAGYLLR